MHPVAAQRVEAHGRLCVVRSRARHRACGRLVWKLTHRDSSQLPRTTDPRTSQRVASSAADIITLHGDGPAVSGGRVGPLLAYNVEPVRLTLELFFTEKRTLAKR
jgi:hypothetical protein